MRFLLSNKSTINSETGSIKTSHRKETTNHPVNNDLVWYFPHQTPNKSQSSDPTITIDHRQKHLKNPLLRKFWEDEDLWKLPLPTMKVFQADTFAGDHHLDQLPLHTIPPEIYWSNWKIANWFNWLLNAKFQRIQFENSPFDQNNYWSALE